MSLPPFGWLWGDPAESVDRLRDLRQRLEAAEKEQRARELRANRRKIRKLLKAAKRRALKGQR